jgi:hypothetical protein
VLVDGLDFTERPDFVEQIKDTLADEVIADIVVYRGDDGNSFGCHAPGRKNVFAMKIRLNITVGPN